MNYLLIALTFLLTSCNSKPISQPMDYTTVKTLDISKYMGTWYEIARFDHPFERGMVGVTATYTLNTNGKVQVLNAGYKPTLDGKFKSAKAKAILKNPDKPGELKVYFFPFIGADYYVLELDENYQWALVGSSSPNYLWILSRTPHLDDQLYQNILDLASKRGYNLNQLIKVEQNSK